VVEPRPRLEGPPEQRHTFGHAHETIAWRSRAGQTALTVVADDQPDGPGVTGHEDVDPGCVPCVTLRVGDRLLGNPKQRCLDRGLQIVEIAAVLDIDPQALGPFSGGQALDVGYTALDGHVRGAVPPPERPDDGSHLGKGA